MNEFLKMMQQYFLPYRKYVLGALTANVLSAFMNIFSFMLIMPILNILFQVDTTHYQLMEWGGGDMKTTLINNVFYYSQQAVETFGAANALLVIGLVLSAFTLLKTGCYFLGTALLMPLRTGVVRDIRQKIYDHILHLPLSYFTTEKRGDLLTRISTDAAEVDNSIASSLDAIIKNPILILIYLLWMLWMSWQLTLFTLFVVPVMAFAIGRIGRSLKAKSLEQQQTLSQSMSEVEETLTGIRVIKAFTAEGFFHDRFKRINDTFCRLACRVAIRQGAAHPVSEFLGTVMIVIVLWFGGYLIFIGHGLLGASMFINYIIILYSTLQPIKDLSHAGYNISRGLASMHRINEILDAQNPILETQGSKELRNLGTEISLEHVSFSYPNASVASSTEVLHDINMLIPAGKTVAIVGESGSGKSTLVDLLERYYDVTDGRITFDGIDIRDLQISSLRQMIGYVGQQSFLFNTSINENVELGNKGIREPGNKGTVDAGRSGEVLENTTSLDQRLNSPIPQSLDPSILVGEGGCRLSGGQRQRVAIARALAKNPTILILDEATSALDSQSEHVVQETLDSISTTPRTTIAIAHRLSTIVDADQIYVLSNGRIVEHGTHTELMKNNGLYNKLYSMQVQNNFDSE